MQDQKTAACTLYPGVIPIMAYMGGGLYGVGGGLRSKGRVPFSGSGAYKRVENLLVEAYEGEGESFLLSGVKAKKVLQMHFMALKKSKKRSDFVIYSYFFKTEHIES